MKVKTSLDDRQWIIRYTDWINDSTIHTDPDIIKECKVIRSLVQDVNDMENFSIDAVQLMMWVFDQIKHGDQQHQDWLRNKLMELAYALQKR